MIRSRGVSAIAGMVAAALAVGCEAGSTLLAPDAGGDADAMIVRARQGLGTAARLGGWEHERQTAQGTNTGAGTAASIDPATVGLATRDAYEVCAVYRGTVGPPVRIDYTVDFDDDGVDIADFVTLSDGECATVHTYRMAGSNGGAQLQVVGATAQAPQGYTPSYLRSFVPGLGPSTPASDAEASGDSSSDTFGTAHDLGFSVVFILTGSGGGGGIIG